MKIALTLMMDYSVFIKTVVTILKIDTYVKVDMKA